MVSAADHAEDEGSVKVGVVYGTNFGTVSAGGIQTVVRSLGAFAPVHMAITYFGAGELEGSLPRDGDEYIDLLRGRDPEGATPLNLRYAAALTRSRVRRRLREMDLLVAHRVEHVPLLPFKPKRVVVVHGGTRNARLSARSPVFGLAYPILEVVARRMTTLRFSVSPGEHVLGSRPSMLLEPLTVPLAKPFLAAGPPARTGMLESVTFCGRLTAEKQPRLAIEVAAELGVSCDLIGDGPLLDELIEYARGLGVRLRTHGHLAQHDLVCFYQQTATVLLSVSLFEGYSLAVIEAASCGVPVVGLRGPGVARAVEAAGGVMVDTRDDLAVAVSSAWDAGNSIPVEALRMLHDPKVIASGFWARCVASLSGRRS